MTWQKVTGYDATETSVCILSLHLTLENKDGEEYDTQVEMYRRSDDFEDLVDAIENGAEWVDIDFDAPRNPAVTEWGDGPEDVDEADDPELVTDGGEDVTEYVSDERIEDQIAQYDDPDHEDATTVAEVRDLLAHLQTTVEYGWDEYMGSVEAGTIDVVAETPELLVLDTGEHELYAEEIDLSYDGDVDAVTMDVLSGVMHELARQHTDHDWDITYPLVVRKPASFEAGQRYVEAVMLSLLDRGLSPGQAWAYYGVTIRGNSRNSWASRCGYSDHSAVSEPLRKAERKLP